MSRAAALLAVALACAALASAAQSQRQGGRYLVYTRATGKTGQSVWIGDVEGRRMRKLTRGGYGLVSPDGETIAVSRRSGILTIHADGSGGRFVARGKPVAWLPDSRHLLAIQRKALVNVDLGDRSIDVVERAAVVAWSLSPDGQTLAYQVYRRRVPSGQCWFDVYTARVDGSSKRRLTRGGRSSNPVWGARSIAYAYTPPGTGCFQPRVWLMDADGRNKAPLMRTLPKRFGENGYYGVRPFAWVRGRPLLLATVPTEWGPELAVVDTRDGRAWKPDLDPRPRYRRPMYVDYASRDGRHVIGAACGAEGPCTIRIYSVLDGRRRHVASGNVGYPHWNR